MNFVTWNFKQAQHIYENKDDVIWFHLIVPVAPNKEHTAFSGFVGKKCMNEAQTHGVTPLTIIKENHHRARHTRGNPHESFDLITQGEVVYNSFFTCRMRIG
jgi:uncharacterized SAM-binding protein YcdF (DUF218 family)